MSLPVRKIIASSAASAWLSRAFGLIVNLAMYPIIVAAVGKESFGVWVVVSQIILFFSLTDLGVTNSISRFVARYRGLNDRESLSRVAVTALVFLAAISFILALGVLVFAMFVPTLLKVPPELAVDAQKTFLIAGLFLAASFPLKISQGILSGFQRYSLPQLVLILTGAIELAIVYLVAKQGNLGLIELAWISCGTAFLGQAILMVSLIAHRQEFRSLRSSFSSDLLKELLGVGMSSLLLTGSGLLFRTGLTLGVSWYLNLTAAGIFGTVLVLVNHLSFLLMQIVRPMTTLSSEMESSGQRERLELLSFRMMRLVFAAGAIFVAGCGVFGTDFFRLWLAKGDWSLEEFEIAGQALWIMAAALALGIPQMTTQLVLLGTGKHWQATRIYLASSILAFGMGHLLMANGLGIWGAVAGWSFFYFLLGFVFYPALQRQLFKKSNWKMYLELYGQGCLIGLLFFALCFGMRWFWNPKVIWSLLLEAAICCFIFAPVFYRFSDLWKIGLPKIKRRSEQKLK